MFSHVWACIITCHGIASSLSGVISLVWMVFDQPGCNRIGQSGIGDSYACRWGQCGSMSTIPTFLASPERCITLD